MFTACAHVVHQGLFTKGYLLIPWSIEHVTEDSWIHGLADTTPRGTGTDLRICPLANYWIYLKFDLSSITGFVTDTELRMSRFGGSRPEEISAYLITDDSWTEAALTSVNRPAPVSPPNGTGLVAGSYDVWQ